MVKNYYYENLINLKELKGNTHPFHIVDQSPWPLFTALNVFNLLICAMLYMHSRTFVIEGGSTFKFLFMFLLALGGCIFCMFGWLSDVKGEACYEGHHTVDVARGLRMGIALFIVSEAMFFFAFFWALFHSALVPSVEIGSVWPPMGMPVFHAGGVPLMNTFVLLLSGSFVTLSHHAIVNRLGDHAIYLMLIGILWGLIFELWQFQEYENSWFSINDGIFGSVFFMITGFHGFHVMLGLCGLIYTWFRLRKGEMSSEHHVGFEGAAWYWHFVDVVWLIVFWTIYWWGMVAVYNY